MGINPRNSNFIRISYYEELIMEDIQLSIINGQWKQAVRLCKNSNYEFADIMELIHDDPFMDESDWLHLFKSAVSEGYIQFHNDYEE